MPGFDRFGRGWDFSYAEGRGFEDGHDHPGISLALPDLVLLIPTACSFNC